jgi:hypothetical protein
MDNKNIRKMMFLKRRLMKSLRYSPGRFISLSREENLVEVDVEVLDIYSQSFVQEILDPRSNQMRGHYFQERKVVRIHNVVVEPKQGVVYSQDGKLIRESTCWPTFQFYSSFPWNPPTKISSLEIDDGVILSSNPYGHWLFEDLPSTIEILSKHPNAILLVAANPPKYVLDYLSRVENEVVFLKSPVKIRSLIMIEKGEDSGWPHPQDASTLQNFKKLVVDSMNILDSTKIYASRRKVKRSPVNELEIEQLFASSGFQVYSLEDFNFYDEIKLISNCTFLAGVHGSALMNSIWMSPGSTVYEIINDSYWTEYGHRLPRVVGHRYIYSTYSGEMTAEVPLDSIKERLNQ